jgi:hypothetical protein
MWNGRNVTVRKLIGVMMCSVLALFVMSLSAFANAPKDVRLSWNQADRVLDVRVIHKTEDPKRHYIRRIRVLVNGKEVDDRRYKRQSDSGGVHERFVLGNVPKGATITVTAFCNLEGSATKSLKTGQGGSGQPEKPGPNPNQPDKPKPDPNKPGAPEQPGKPKPTPDQPEKPGPNPNQPDKPKPDPNKPGAPEQPGKPKPTPTPEKSHHG